MRSSPPAIRRPAKPAAPATSCSACSQTLPGGSVHTVRSALASEVAGMNSHAGPPPPAMAIAKRTGRNAADSNSRNRTNRPLRSTNGPWMVAGRSEGTSNGDPSGISSRTMRMVVLDWRSSSARARPSRIASATHGSSSETSTSASAGLSRRSDAASAMRNARRASAETPGYASSSALRPRSNGTSGFTTTSDLNSIHGRAVSITLNVIWIA